MPLFLHMRRSSSYLCGDMVSNLHNYFDIDDKTNRGIKHDFPFINIRMVPREVLKNEGEARGFQPSRVTLRMLMNDKIMFDRYYCINSTKHCENDENIGALYFITSPHFPTRVRYAIFGPRLSTHNLACALRDAW